MNKYIHLHENYYNDIRENIRDVINSNDPQELRACIHLISAILDIEINELKSEGRTMPRKGCC